MNYQKFTDITRWAPIDLTPLLNPILFVEWD